MSILRVAKRFVRKSGTAFFWRGLAFLVVAASLPVVLGACGGEKPVEPSVSSSPNNSVQSNTQSNSQTSSNLDPQTGLEKEGRARAVDALSQLDKLHEEDKKNGIEPAPEKDVEVIDPYNDATTTGMSGAQAESSSRMPSPFKKSE